MFKLCWALANTNCIIINYLIMLEWYKFVLDSSEVKIPKTSIIRDWKMKTT